MARDLDDSTDTWWTVREAAEHLGISERQVRNYGVPRVLGRMQRSLLLQAQRDARARRRASRFGRDTPK